MSKNHIDTIGVVIVSYASSDVIEDCLNSLLASDYAKLKIVVCDNASPDPTVELIQSWAQGCGASHGEVTPDISIDHIPKQITVIRSPVNLGYAGGVNTGLKYLLQDPSVDLFWVLNPDCVVETGTAAALVKQAEKVRNFSLMGSRIQYLEGDKVIQSDGGQVNLWTGVCKNINQGQQPNTATAPSVDELQFISGASMIASRKFVETVGLLEEDYFLYYEEVDWAMRRGDLPLTWCSEATVYHHGGTSIGTGAHNRAASAFANYFNFRNRMMFVSRFRKMALPVAYFYTLLKIIKIWLNDGKDQAIAGWRGLNFMSPPKSVSDRIDPAARAIAFSPKGPRN